MNSPIESLTDWSGEPLTATDFVRGLRDALEARVWVETSEARCGRGCCGSRFFTACSECGAEEGDDGRKPDFQKHKEGCRLERLLLQANAFLNAEEALEQERENGQEAVPHHPE